MHINALLVLHPQECKKAYDQFQMRLLLYRRICQRRRTSERVIFGKLLKPAIELGFDHYHRAIPHFLFGERRATRIESLEQLKVS